MADLTARPIQTFTDEFEFRGMRCFPSPGNDASWHYLPAAADVRRNASGAPELTMVDMGSTAYLLFAATWGPDEEHLEALRVEIARRIPDGSTARVVLSFAPVSAVQSRALVGDGSGSFDVLATNPTSGLPPYDAVFNLALRGEKLAFARAGHSGRQGFLAVEYTANLRVPVAVSATFTAETGALASWMSSQEDADDVHGLLEQAVQRGLAAVTVDVPDAHAAVFAAALYDRVLAEAARTLPNWLDHHSHGDFRVSVALTEEVDEPVRAFADIGMIVAATSTSEATGGIHVAD